MTFGLTLLKSSAGKREETRKYLESLLHGQTLQSQKKGVDINEVFISFGWPDFILVIHANNVEQIKSAIVEIQSELQLNVDPVETSTIICTTTKEIENNIGVWGGLLPSRTNS